MEENVSIAHLHFHDLKIPEDETDTQSPLTNATQQKGPDDLFASRSKGILEV